MNKNFTFLLLKLKIFLGSAQKIFVENEISLALRPISVEELDSRILDSRLV